MSVADLRLHINAAAVTHRLDPRVLCGQVQVESEGDPYAFNPEPKYQWFWDLRKDKPFRKLDPSELSSKRPPGDFSCLKGDPDQEWWLQQASIGLMQIMGAVAREHGFDAPYLLKLVEPAVNLDYGCRHLAQLLRGVNGDLRCALARYNGGAYQNTPGQPLRNEAYVQKVEKAMRFFS
jgi:hypothetical protein